MSIIAWIIVGIIAGWIAEKIMGRNDGLLMNLVIGVVGVVMLVAFKVMDDAH